MNAKNGNAGTVQKGVYVGRLDTVNDWRRQIGKIFREMRSGTLPHEAGTRLTYVAQIGAQLAKVEQELRELETLRRQVERLDGSSGSPPLQSIELLPRIDNGSDQEAA